MKDNNMNDNQMQDENTKRELLEEIRKSAGNQEIPNGLNPENLDRLLEQGRKPKKKFREFTEAAADFLFRYKGTAGVCAALAAAVIIAVPVIKNLTLNGSSASYRAVRSSDAAADIEDAAPAESASHDEAGQDKTEKDKAAGYLAGNSYEELYEQIYTETEKAGREWEKRTNPQASDGAAWEEKSSAEAGGSDAGAAAAESAAADSATGGTGAEYSDTNVRTEGVDEGDIVKTDGTYIYTLSRSGILRIVSAEGGNMALAGQTVLQDLSDGVQEMYVDGNTLCIVTSGYGTELAEDRDGAYTISDNNFVRLYTYDITDKSNIKQQGVVEQDGYYHSTRKVGNYVYLLSEFYPAYQGEADPDRPWSYIPSVNKNLLESSDVMYPAIPQTESGQLLISSVDLNHPGEVKESKSLIGGIGNCYVSADNIFIFGENYTGDETRTQIVKFSYKDGSIQAEAAGSIRGSILNTFSMDEYKGYLRVVATRYENGWWDRKQSNSLYVLDENLKITGKVENLAEEERIYSARFMGDAGYFVTYRQTDPLFSVDLSDPANPRVLGELKITGFSEYLHFYGENKLLGIGWETNPNTGEQLGLKLSMFDISNPADVKEINKMVLKDVDFTQATSNYKSILVNPEENILGFGMGSYNDFTHEPEGYYGVFCYDPEEGFQKLLYQGMSKWMEVSPDGYQVLADVRGIYIGSTFYLCGERRITAFDRNSDYKICGSVEW